MKSKVYLQLFRRAKADERFEDVHRRFLSFWVGSEGPFGLPKSFQCVDPVVEHGGLAAIVFLTGMNGVERLTCTYLFRSEKHLSADDSSLDDKAIGELKGLSPENYADLLRKWLPQLATSFGCYRARIRCSDYAFAYADWGWNEWSDRPTTNARYQYLRSCKGVDVDGRNNIYLLDPAFVWDNELCMNALGYDVHEVARRLEGLAPFVKVEDGRVHAILNEDFHLTYDQYVEMNRKWSAILATDRQV